MAFKRSDMWAFADLVFGPRVFNVLSGILIGVVFTMGLSSERRDVSWAGWALAVLAIFAVSRTIHWLSADYDLPIAKTWAAFLVFGVIGVAWYGMHTWLDTKRDAMPWFSADVRSAFVSDSGPRTLFMVRHASSFGDTVSPIIYLAYLKLVNNSEYVRSVESFKVEASKDEAGPWEEIKSIPLPAGTLLVLTGRPVPSIRRMDLGNGTSRLGTVPDEQSLKHAALSWLGPSLIENELRRPLEPHIPVYGWIALDSYRHTGLSPGRVYFRFTIRDGSNAKTLSVVSRLPTAGNSMDIQANCGFIEVTDSAVDVSNAHLKYYSDPVPSPELKR